jgi:large subunit ribosomal protein L15
VLGTGEITQSLTVKAHKFSASARAKIEAAGGKAEEVGDAPEAD